MEKKTIMCMHDDSKCLIKFIRNFFFVVSFLHHHIDLLQFVMKICNYCLSLKCCSILILNCTFQILLNYSSFNSLWPHWIFIPIYHLWIHVSLLMIVFNCCFDFHIKNTNTIQRFHNIDTKKKITHVFWYPYWWVHIS